MANAVNFYRIETSNLISNEKGVVLFESMDEPTKKEYPDTWEILVHCKLILWSMGSIVGYIL